MFGNAKCLSDLAPTFSQILCSIKSSNRYSEMTKIAFGMLQLLEFQIWFRDWHLRNPNGKISEKNLESI